MITIGINDNNDIYLDAEGNLAVKKDLDAMGDIFINKAETNRGELIYDDEKGIDFFNTIFSSPCYPDLFQTQLMSELENTEETQGVTGFTFETSGGVYGYRAKIQTSYGQVTLNG